MTTFMIGLIGTISCMIGLSTSDNTLSIIGAVLVVGHIIMSKIDKLNEE